jgi:hypothetical protein
MADHRDYLSDLTDVQLEAIRAMDGTPIDVWLDDDGRILKEQFRMDMPGGLGRAYVSIEFFDFGEPVTIEAPPADQVTDWTAKFRDELHI